MKYRLQGRPTEHVVITLQQAGSNPGCAYVETEPQAFGKWWRDFFLFLSVPSPQPFQALGAALGTEDQALRRLDWLLPSPSRILGSRRGMSNSQNGMGGRVRALQAQDRVREEGLEGSREEGRLVVAGGLKQMRIQFEGTGKPRPAPHPHFLSCCWGLLRVFHGVEFHPLCW